MIKYQRPGERGVGSRFSLPAKETLVSWINEKNNRGFSSNQFTFGTPVRVDDNGVVDVPFTYLTTGEKSNIRVQRINLSLVPGLRSISIHSENLSKETILKSIYDQYGLFLDEDFIELIIDKVTLSKETVELNGFNISNDSTPDIGGIDYKLVITDDHLIYEGNINLKVRKSLLTNTNTIARTLDLREFYSQSDEVKPYIETYQPSGYWSVEESKYYHRREVESKLYAIDKGDVIDYNLLANLLTRITKDKWVSSEKHKPFNIKNSNVLYNSLSSKYPELGPVTHSYILVLELSELCSNLQGRVNILYRYSRPTYPNNLKAGSNSII